MRCQFAGGIVTDSALVQGAAAKYFLIPINLPGSVGGEGLENTGTAPD